MKTDWNQDNLRNIHIENDDIVGLPHISHRNPPTAQDKLPS
jgi:hypothetical protein